MQKNKILWQLIPSYLLIIFISLLLVTLYCSHSFKFFHYERVHNELENQAFIIQNQINKDFTQTNKKKIQDLCSQIATKIKTRITVITVTGEVIADSGEESNLMDNHNDRPEIIDALQGKTGSSKRFSKTLKQNMLYVAIPILNDSKIVGVIRTAMPLTLIEDTLEKAYVEIFFGGLIIALFACMLNYNTSKKISLPLEKLEKGALNFAEGNLKNRLPVFKLEEINNVALSMNTMADNLNERMKIITQQNMEQEIILSSMKEGLIVINTEKEISKLNKSAAALLDINLSDSSNKQIKNTIKNIDFYKFISKAIESKLSQEKEIVIANNSNNIYIQIYSIPIFDENFNRKGTLIALNDITKIKKLENIRQDFVSNVSHELKTPVTSIQGFVETLLDSELEDIDETKNFLRIVKKHTGRLKAIIEDLLSLSRIEQESTKDDLNFEEINLNDVICTAVQTCETKAKNKNIKINANCNEFLNFTGNSLLLEQAIINLIDNAIKYSDENKDVTVDAKAENNKILINIIDNGIGIPKTHLPRLFERFYRVDKARSRKYGGTGLGLSIVKHIINLHGGIIKVQSEPEKGSTFTISLPKTNLY